ncbi:MAG: glycosyltransferase [Candidatus Woesearchaeota archaeon]|nr:glycosyltransferase [Candidatus Woesearchaeota archaeon]
MAEKIRVSIGIPVYNEEKNIVRLLQAIESQKTRIADIEKVFIINDGSTDSTKDKVSRFIKLRKSGGKFELISYPVRKGKWFAINEFLKRAKSPVLFLESADNLPEKGCFDFLAGHFFNRKAGIVNARIIPVNDRKSFFGFSAHLIYELHYEISLERPKFGELIVFRNIVKKIPHTIVDEDEIARMIQEKGYSLLYEPKAIVYNRGPENISDFISQRRRIYCGYLVLREKSGYISPTLNSIRIAGLVLRKIRPGNIFYACGASFLECLSRFLGWLDYSTGNAEKHIIWKQIKSVKNLRK